MALSSAVAVDLHHTLFGVCALGRWVNHVSYGDGIEDEICVVWEYLQAGTDNGVDLDPVDGQIAPEVNAVDIDIMMCALGVGM